jgi:ABC-type antimicrobial peptide transport system permease subunit
MKALGASDAGIVGGFVGEAAVLGAVAAMAGMAAGALAAGLMGEALFRVWLWPHAATLAAAFVLTVALAAASALVPWPVLRAAQPAALLRGE